MDIPQFYEGRHLFLTGVTGFMGKVLLEKILRCCPGVSKVYVLIRPKKSETPENRLATIFRSPLFSRVLKQRPNSRELVVPIEGDVLKPCLGLSDADISVVGQNVSIVFHCAASVRFQEPLHDALKSNVRSVDNLLSLIKKMEKFDVLVHLSTAYAYCYRSYIEEKVYPVAVNPGDMVRCSNWLSEGMFEDLKPRLLQDHPNTYTYTKSVAENLLVDTFPPIRTVIVRPSIVTSSWKEPMPGWCDSWNGPVGLLVTFGKGLLRTMLGKRTSRANFVPVDVPINLMLAAAWHMLLPWNESSLIVYNCTSSESNPITWGQLSDYMTSSARALPLESPARIPLYGSSISPNHLRHQVEWLFCHWIPSYVADYVLRLFKKNPRFVKWYHKIYAMCDCLAYFTMRSWKWDNDNMHELQSLMSEPDRAMFYFDTSDINWEDHIADYHAGVKKYILKEDMKSVPVARLWIRRRQLLSAFAKIALFLCLVFFFFNQDIVPHLFIFAISAIFFARKWSRGRPWPLCRSDSGSGVQ